MPATAWQAPSANDTIKKLTAWGAKAKRCISEPPHDAARRASGRELRYERHAFVLVAPGQVHHGAERHQAAADREGEVGGFGGALRFVGEIFAGLVVAQRAARAMLLGVAVLGDGADAEEAADADADQADAAQHDAERLLRGQARLRRRLQRYLFGRGGAGGYWRRDRRLRALGRFDQRRHAHASGATRVD